MLTRRFFTASLLADLMLTLLTVACSAGSRSEPRHSFAGAYAQQGSQGPARARGPIGSQGPPGPVGQDASTAIDDLAGQRGDLETGSGDQASVSVADLAAKLDDLEGSRHAGTSVSDLGTASLTERNSEFALRSAERFRRSVVRLIHRRLLAPASLATASDVYATTPHDRASTNLNGGRTPRAWRA